MGCRMDEFQAFGVEVEPCSGFAIERVAEDGRVQSLGMGGVHAELVRPSRQREESDARTASRFVAQDPIARDGRFPMHRVYHLTRTVGRIRAERERNLAFRLPDKAVQQRHITFLHRPMEELRL